MTTPMTLSCIIQQQQQKIFIDAPEIIWCRHKYKKKITYKGKEHSHLEIAELIELRGWAKRENVMPKMKAIFLQFCAKTVCATNSNPQLTNPEVNSVSTFLKIFP